jgi:hypothetical protein
MTTLNGMEDSGCTPRLSRDRFTRGRQVRERILVRLRSAAILVIVASGLACGGGGAPRLQHPQAQLSVQVLPGSLSFGTQQVGIAAARQVVVVVNSGSEAVAVSKVSAAGDFAETNNCSPSLGVAGVCLVSVAFTPKATGIRTGTLTITTSTTGAAQTVALSGTGAVAVEQFSSEDLSFPGQNLGTLSAAQAVNVTNTGKADLVFSTVAMGGANASDFAIRVDTCTRTPLAFNNACTIKVIFAPSATGNRSASLDFTDNAANGSRTVTLSGIGTEASVALSVPGVSFDGQITGTVSPPLAETVTNTGSGDLTISAVTIGGTNAADFSKSSDTCTGATVAATDSCTISIMFSPSQTGSRIATISITDNAVNSPQNLTLTGLGTGPLAGVFTQRYDNARSGQNSQEVYLAPSNVTEGRFGKLFSLQVDGQVYAQPLYVGNVRIPGQGVHNVVYVATEGDSVYAFDADAQSPNPLWRASFVNPSAGITTVPCEDLYGGGPTQRDIFPQVGITSTPAIDPATGTLYVSVRTREPLASASMCTAHGAYNYCYRLHALDIGTGSEKFGGPVPVSGSVPGSGYDSSGGIVTFSSFMQLQRAGLLVLNGAVYLGFGSQNDDDPYHGWVIAYDAVTLKQVAVFNVTPNAARGGIWQAGAGISADDNGFLYVVTGNGTFDANTPGGADYGDSVLKLQLQAGKLAVVDYFTPANQATLEDEDLDLGTSPALILPDQSGPYPRLLATAGKDGRIWLINRDKLGEFQPNDAGAVRVIPQPGSDSLYGGLTYWNGNLYIQEVGAALNDFVVDRGLPAQFPATSTTQEFGVFPNYPPVVSANGEENAVLWIVTHSSFDGPAVLHAFDASDLSSELYDSSQLSNNRDLAGGSVKFVVPTVANGKVYLGTTTELDVYGLLP